MEEVVEGGVVMAGTDIERGGKRRHSQCPDFGELPNGGWALVLIIRLICVWKPGALSDGVGALSVY